MIDLNEWTKIYEQLINTTHSTIFDVLSHFYPKFKLQKQVPLWLLNELNRRQVTYLMINNFVSSLIQNSFEHSFKGKNELRSMLFKVLFDYNYPIEDLLQDIYATFHYYITKHHKNKIVNVYNLVQYTTRRTLYKIIAFMEDSSIEDVRSSNKRYSYTFGNISAIIAKIVAFNRQIWNDIVRLINTIVRNKLQKLNKETIRQIVEGIGSHNYILGTFVNSGVRFFYSMLKITMRSIKYWGLRLLSVN